MKIRFQLKRQHSTVYRVRLEIFVLLPGFLDTVQNAENNETMQCSAAQCRSNNDSIISDGVCLQRGRQWPGVRLQGSHWSQRNCNVQVRCEILQILIPDPCCRLFVNSDLFHFPVFEGKLPAQDQGCQLCGSTPLDGEGCRGTPPQDTGVWKVIWCEVCKSVVFSWLGTVVNNLLFQIICAGYRDVKYG